ncbi:DUF3489 domain-containing protein [Sphingomonas nostoxanthinifaciens]|uniref:DUF3489 domain-containing protein n=1 Tax=Sphingomonas nostoxanthinifaciens TaxID=2872652 RepID=UPI001CC211CC|nr:DUF3489 domain-containing protein [Sphingomonas nostoxanthinifaciens]UAK25604.1 DUF3489 domain-containing protein [Sphingomonas nostoxanthinifaciens]
MPRLSDTQTILLSTAAQREDRSLYPLPGTLKPSGGLSRALAALTTAGLIGERETSIAYAVSRTDGDLRFGLFATDAGLAAIGIEPDEVDPPAPAQPPAVAPSPARSNKTAAVLDLLRRDEGATLPELIAATGWLPHSTRAALTGLRKKGHAIERLKRDGQTCYRIGAAA